MTNIIVNAQHVYWLGKTISYEEILALALKKGFMTVVISYPKQNIKSRTIIPHDVIDVYEGMIIGVADTSKA